MGVHHAWGRTLKDVFQRYKALRGFDQRYQNGFDCQGLWVEVEVEKALGLNSKREIEEYGLAEFAERCKERVASTPRSSPSRIEAARLLDGLGRRLLHVLRHEHRVHLALPQGRARAGLALPGASVDAVVPALRHVDLPARGLLGRVPASSTTRRSTSASRSRDREGESLVVWTTTPWTLPANVAAAVQPDAEYGRTRGRRVVRRRARAGRGVRGTGARRRSSSGARIAGPFDDLPAAAERRAPRHPVERGLARRRDGHRPHRARGRHGGLRARPRARAAGARSRSTSPASSTTLRPAGRALAADAAEEPIVASLRERGLLVEAGTDRPPLSHVLALQDAAPLPRRRRLVHLRRGDQAADARRERDRRMDAGLLLEADGRLAAEHGRLEHLAQALLRAAAPALSVRLRPPDGDRLARGARAARAARHRRAARAAPAVDRRRDHRLRGVRGGGDADPRGGRRLARRRASFRSRRSAGTTRRATSLAGTRPAPRRA